MRRRRRRFARHCARPASRSVSIRASCGAGTRGTRRSGSRSRLRPIHSDRLASTRRSGRRATFGSSGSSPIERTHHMAEQKPFLVPVVVDDTRDEEAVVPDAFRAVQWTRLPGGDAPPAFVERIQAPAVARSGSCTGRGQAASRRSPARCGRTPTPASSPTASRQTQWVLLLIAAVAVIGLGYFAVDKFVAVEA